MGAEMSGEAEGKGGTNEGHVWRSNGALEILLSALLRVEQRTAALLARDDSIIARAKAFVAKHFEPLAAAGFEGRPEEVLSAEERAELSQLSALILNRSEERRVGKE